MNKNQFVCPKCSRDDFKSHKGLTIHNSRSHPYVPPPPPKKTTEEVKSNLFLDKKNLLGGSRLALGDVFYLVEKCVIKKITYTEGSKDVEIGYEVTKSNWQENKPLS